MQIVPFNDVRAGYVDSREAIDQAIAEVLDRGDFIQGAAVGQFEEDFAQYTGAKFCVSCSSGTTALHLLLAASGIVPGDEVITSPCTFAATAEAILHSGAIPVFADVDPVSSNICRESVSEVMTVKTRAVLYVHLHGNPAHATDLSEFCLQNGLIFLEDCAQAHGTRIGERHAGRLGLGGAFSFFPAKNLGAFGDAGALITDSESLAQHAAKLANHGRADKYRHDIVGYNYRMDTIQAAILRVRLNDLEYDVKARRTVADRYRAGLSRLPLEVPMDPDDGQHSYHLFAIHLDERDALQEFLTKQGVQTGVHYPIPLHRQVAFKPWLLRNLPQAEAEARRTLSLPMWPGISTESIDYVVQQVHAFFHLKTLNLS